MYRPQHRPSRKEIVLKKQHRTLLKKLSPAAPPVQPPAAPPPLNVDDAPLASIRHVGSMFQPVAELVAWRDMTAPATGYDSLFETWQEEAEEDIGSAASATRLTTKEAESFDIGKEIAFSVLQKFLGAARSIAWSSRTVEERLQHVEALMARPQVPQRTPAWFAQGKEVLTASEFSTLFGSPRAIGQLVLHKVPTEGAAPSPNRLACLTCEMSSLDWGVRFEPVVKQILKARWGADIQDTGRLMHPTDPHLAASPDGIIVAATDSARIGRLVEIKCPIRRIVGEGIPFEYWCQMQLQMDVTDIDECEYVEVKLDSPERGSTSMDLSGSVPEGYVWLLQEPTTAQMCYAYTIQERAERESTGWELIESIPWRVAEMYTKTVVRDRAWMASTQPARVAFWEKVATARRGEFQCPESSRKRAAKPVITVCKIED